MRRWRVGTISMGLLLITVGVTMLLTQVFEVQTLEYFLKWWPVILIILGVEVMINVFTSGQENSKVMYDGFSIFIVSTLVIFSIGAYTLTTLIQRDLLFQFIH